MRHSLLILLFAGVLAASTHATVLVPADLPELSRDALVIARGQVVAVDAQWSDGRRTVETIVTLATERYLKGDFGSTIRFRVPGGTLGRIRNVVVGAPQFTPGERVIVFLGSRGPRVPYILGLGQGVYRVGLGATGEPRVTPPSLAPGVTGPIVRGTAARRPAPLAEFERDVLALAGLAR